MPTVSGARPVEVEAVRGIVVLWVDGAAKPVLLTNLETRDLITALITAQGEAQGFTEAVEGKVPNPRLSSASEIKRRKRASTQGK